MGLHSSYTGKKRKILKSEQLRYRKAIQAMAAVKDMLRKNNDIANNIFINSYVFSGLYSTITKLNKLY